MSDARALRLAARFLKEAGGSMDVKNLWQAAKMVHPSEYASAVYCLVHGCDPGSITGDAADEAMKDPIAREAHEAKEIFDKINLTHPKASELALRYPLEIIKKNKGNLSKLPKDDQARLTHVAQATISVVRYMRALTAAKTAPTRDQDMGVSYSAAQKIFNEVRMQMAEGPNSIGTLDTPEDKNRFVLLLKQNEHFTEEWVEQEVGKAAGNNFVFNTLDGPTISAEDAYRLTDRNSIEATLKSALEVCQKLKLMTKWPNLDCPEGTGLIAFITDARNAQMAREFGHVEHALGKAVPAVLLWYSVRGVKK